MSNATTAKHLAEFYRSAGAVHVNRHNGIVVCGMRLSPFYFQGMQLSTSVDGLRMVTDLMSDRLQNVEFDVVAAPSISGIPYAAYWLINSRSAW